MNAFDQQYIDGAMNAPIELDTTNLVSDATKHERLMRLLEHMDACDEAKEWVRKNRYTLRQAWFACTEAGWLAWLLHRTDVERYDGCTCGDCFLGGSYCGVPRSQQASRIREDYPFERVHDACVAEARACGIL